MEHAQSPRPRAVLSKHARAPFASASTRSWAPRTAPRGVRPDHRSAPHLPARRQGGCAGLSGGVRAVWGQQSGGSPGGDQGSRSQAADHRRPTAHGERGSSSSSGGGGGELRGALLPLGGSQPQIHRQRQTGR
ncbi:hypothetical protein AOLI_G00185310 [Acnodon oligacanthus]